MILLNWSPRFRDNLMPYLAQDEMYLHMDSTLYSNSKELGMVIPGGILIDLAIMDLARNVIIKRKLNK